MDSKEKYICQQDDWSCGLIAIYNANIWKYGDASHVDMNDLRKKCKLDEIRGIERWNLDLSSLDIKDKRRNYIYNIDSLIQALSEDHGVIFEYSFSYTDRRVGCHFVFTIKCGEWYLVTNALSEVKLDNETTELRYKHVFYRSIESLRQNLLDYNPRDEEGLSYPCGWIILPENPKETRNCKRRKISV